MEIVGTPRTPDGITPNPLDNLDPKRALLILNLNTPRPSGEMTRKEQRVATGTIGEIISRLPDNLVGILQEQLRSVGITSIPIDKEGNPQFSSDEEKERIKAELFGKIFELLVKEEYFESVGGDTPEERRMSEKFLDILQNPAKYGLSTRRGRNPDMLRVRNGKITDIYEIKSGPLGERAYNQFDGFTEYIESILNELKYLQDKKPNVLAQNGIPENIARLRLPEKSKDGDSDRGRAPRVWLIVPYRWEQEMSKRATYSAEMTRMNKMLMSGEVGIIHSIFTREDIGSYLDILFLEVVRGLRSNPDE